MKPLSMMDCWEVEKPWKAPVLMLWPFTVSPRPPNGPLGVVSCEMRNDTKVRRVP